MKINILFVILTVFAGLKSYSQGFKLSEINKEEQTLIFTDLSQTTEEPFTYLLKVLQNNPIHCFRHFHGTIESIDSYDFHANPLEHLSLSIETVWFYTDSVIAVAEKFQNKYQGLMKPLQSENSYFKDVKSILEKKRNVPFTLFFLSGQSNWSIIIEGKVFVIENGKLIDFNKFYKRKYCTVKKFKQSL